MKKWLILVAAFAVLGAIFLMTTLFSSKEKTLGLCEQFIHYVRDNNPDAAYELFTPQAKSATSIEVWRQQASDLRSAYYDPNNPTVTQKSRTVTNTDEAGAELSVTEVYVIPSGESRYLGTCHTELTDGTYFINGYESKADLDSADYKQE